MVPIVLRRQRLGAWLPVAAATVAALAVTAAALLPIPAQAQRGSMFDNWFAPFPQQQQQQHRPRPEVRTPPADFSRAPASTRKVEAPPKGHILVLGDAMADWLGYGLEEGLGDTPEYGIIRKHRTVSGLLRYDPRNEANDWAHAAREILAAEKPSFIVVMLGLHDRQAIRERVAPAPPAKTATPAAAAPGATPPAAAPSAKPADPSAAPAQPPEQEDADKPAQSNSPEQLTITRPEPAQRPRPASSYEFRTEKWAELYAKRIDDMIAVLKSRGVPVIWVGLPSVRGQRSTADAHYLNELYRARAEKNGIVYVDIWDGFVDEGGRFALQGPDPEGQIRRLRASDGVYFTKAGARKLAHYVEREIQRASRSPVAVALPTTEPQPQSPTAKPGGLTARPLAGPVMPLTSTTSTPEDGLLGAANAKPAPDHVTVTRVLVNGEPLQTPAGRGDDFRWPRRGVAPFGSDPAVATTNLPLPIMRAAAPKTVLAPTADATPVTAPPPRRAAPRPQPSPQVQQQRQQTFPSFFPFFR